LAFYEHEDGFGGWGGNMGGGLPATHSGSNLNYTRDAAKRTRWSSKGLMGMGAYNNAPDMSNLKTLWNN